MDTTTYYYFVKSLFNPTPEHDFFGLITEVGELATAFKSSWYKNEPLNTTNMLEELGDIVFYIVATIQQRFSPDHDQNIGLLEEVLTGPDLEIDLYGTNANFPLHLAIKHFEGAPLEMQRQFYSRIFTSILPPVLSDKTAIKKLITVIKVLGQHLCDANIWQIIQFNYDKLSKRYPDGHFDRTHALQRQDKLPGEI